MRRLKVLLPVLAAWFSIHCGSARADVFDFTYTAGGSTVITGTLTALLQSGNTWLITDISGERNGVAIAGLVAPGGRTDGLGTNNNLLYYLAGGDNPKGNFFLDGSGLAYALTNGLEYRVFVFGSYSEISSTNSGLAINSIDVTYAPVPLPGAGVLSYLLVLLGGAVRWRKALLARTRTALAAMHADADRFVRPLRQPTPL